MIQSLAITVNAAPTVIDRLDMFRKKRNTAAYQRVGLLSQQDAQEMIQIARDLREQVGAWLKDRHALPP